MSEVKRRYKTKHEKRKELLQLLLNSEAIARWVSVPEVAMILLILLLEIMKIGKYQIMALLEEIQK